MSNISQSAPTLAEEVVNGLGLGCAEVARMIPPRRNGRPCHPSCIHRWMHDRCRAGGKVIRLEGIPGRKPFRHLGKGPPKRAVRDYPLQ